jgi:hypothetical protein
VRPLLTAGLAVVAVGLGTLAAVPALSATTSSTVSASTGPASTATAASAVTAVPGAVTPASRDVYGLHVTGLPATGIPATGLKPAAASAASPVFNAWYGVSCLSAGSCLAVGQSWHASTSHGAAIAYRYAGGTWGPVSLPLPAGATNSYLASIDCTGGRCLAVGTYQRGTASYALAEFWNGSAWTASPLPQYWPGSSADILEAVSCFSPVNCLATGYYVPTSNSAANVALAEYWNGSAWKAYQPPTPASAYAYNNLDAVSCPRTNFCLAGGFYADSGGYSVVLAEYWNGSSFHLVTLPAPTAEKPYYDIIDGVSCTSSVDCAIVGTASQQTGTNAYANHGFTEVESASAWTVLNPPWPAGQQTFLDWVSCSSATFCVAAGGIGAFVESGTGGHALTATWNGSTWTPRVFNPPAGDGGSFDGVDCLSPGYCAVAGLEGPFNSTTTAHGLTGFWDGSTWTTVPTA